MTLGELIAALKRLPPDRKVEYGFGEPDSYRGYYDQLAFAPKLNTTVGEMLKHAESALGQTFTGYKGGDYVMKEYTDVWISRYSYADDEKIGHLLLAYMVGAPWPLLGDD